MIAPSPGSTVRALARWARETPDAPAVVDQGSVVSYRMLARRTIAAIRLLSAAGARAGTIVGIECSRPLPHLILILGCEAIGAAHASLTVLDLMTDNASEPRYGVLCSATLVPRGEAGQTVIQLDQSFFMALEQGDRESQLLALPDADYPPDTLVRIGRTSGTTGTAKRIGFSRRMVESILTMGEYVLGQQALRYNCVCFYNFTLITTYREANHVLRHGATLVFTTVENYLTDLARFQPCQTFLPVGDAVRVAQSAGEDAVPLEVCRLRLTGGAVPPSLRAMLRSRVTADIFAQYSMNESILLAIMNEDDTGTPLPDVEIRIEDETGRLQADGEPGIVVVRSPRTCAGYLWDATLTERSFRDGWFRSSDLGVMRRPNELVILGRVDDVLNIGGIKVVPGYVEAQIRAFEGVTEAVLLAVDNALGVAEPHVFIECLDLSYEARIKPNLTALMARYFAVFAAHYLTAAPRGGLGKVRRDVLRDIAKRGTNA